MSTALLSDLLPPDSNADPVEVIQEANRSGIEPIQSNEFAATLVRAGVRGKFRELQAKLIDIDIAIPEIQAYGSGEMFRELVAEFEQQQNLDIFDNEALFGRNEHVSESVVANTRSALRRVSAAMELVRSSLVLADEIYDRVDAQISGSNSEYLSIEERTESLIMWAYRDGAKLNSDITGKNQLGSGTRNTRVTTDLPGLLDLLDTIVMELQTLLNIPAYYRTATNSDTSQVETPVKVIYVRRGESLETLALRELGDADKATLIMEFNNLTTADIYKVADEFGLGGWDGRTLNIPYLDTGDRLRNNFVLDAQNGIKAMGRDLANEITASNGDVELLNYTDNLFQSIDNLIQTPVGAIAEDPEYGNRAIKLQGAGAPQIVGQMVAAEMTRALMQNPRIEKVSDMTVIKDADAIRVKFQITAVNRLAESELTAQLDMT